MIFFEISAAGSGSDDDTVWGAWSSCQSGGFRTRTQVCESGTDCPTETESCIFYGNTKKGQKAKNSQFLPKIVVFSVIPENFENLCSQILNRQNDKCSDSRNNSGFQGLNNRQNKGQSFSTSGWSGNTNI